jgi:hypothetical protein
MVEGSGSLKTFAGLGVARHGEIYLSEILFLAYKVPLVQARTAKVSALRRSAFIMPPLWFASCFCNQNS